MAELLDAFGNDVARVWLLWGLAWVCGWFFGRAREEDSVDERDEDPGSFEVWVLLVGAHLKDLDFEVYY